MMYRLRYNAFDPTFYRIAYGIPLLPDPEPAFNAPEAILSSGHVVAVEQEQAVEQAPSAVGDEERDRQDGRAEVAELARVEVVEDDGGGTERGK